MKNLMKSQIRVQLEDLEIVKGLQSQPFKLLYCFWLNHKEVSSLKVRTMSLILAPIGHTMGLTISMCSVNSDLTNEVGGVVLRILSSLPERGFP